MHDRIDGYIYNSPIFVTKFNRHVEYGKSVLNIIDSSIYKSNFSKLEAVSRTDWNIPETREYNFVIDDIINQVQPIYQQLGFQRVERDNSDPWFQQYTMNNFHKWHTHSKADLAVVYFLELPLQSLSTEFYNPINKIITTYTINEGDIIVFPGLSIHRSPNNTSEGRKTVIACNLKLSGLNHDMLPE